MGILELLINQTEDEVSRENLKKIEENNNENVFSTAEVKLFKAEYSTPKENQSFRIAHGFNFVPEDFIQLDLFKDDYAIESVDDRFVVIRIKKTRPGLRLKFLAGRF